MDVRVFNAVGHHVHGANAQHSAVHVEAVKHAIHVVLQVFTAVKNLLPPGFPQIFGGSYQKAGSAAGRVTDDLLGSGIHQLHHHADDMSRRAELPVAPRLGNLAQQILIHVAANICLLDLGHLRVNAVQTVHHLGQHQGGGQFKDRVVHVFGVGAVRIAVQRLDKGKNPLLNNLIHFRRRQIVKHRPLKLLAIDGSPIDGHFFRKDRGIRQAQHFTVLCLSIVHYIQVVNKHEIGNLLNHI